MKIKTSELIAPALDWAVAKCAYTDGRAIQTHPHYISVENYKSAGGFFRFEPSTNWSQGGQIIERERICIYYEERLAPVNTWRGYLNFIHDSVGPTPLIAAMRCVVAVHLGDEVEIPEELNVCDALIKSVSTKLAKR